VDLFAHAMKEQTAANAPLADRMRPLTLEEVVGQEHACGAGTFLGRAITEDRVPSLILWGPPGSGKTTLSTVIAHTTKLTFIPFSAVLGGVKEIRQIVADAHQRLAHHSQRTMLFVDEIHRFNKAQQDAFLPHVENGTIILVGATTENPSFEVNSALLSRMRVVRLKRLKSDHLISLFHQALNNPERGVRGGVTADDEALQQIAAYADGDARRGLNLLEAAADDCQEVITKEVVDRVRQSNSGRYDRGGDQHYDIVSAFIKSMRGSDPDAALYYLARMIAGGENPRFVFRRMVIFAAEDISNADPRALQVAVAAAQGFEQVGMPEGQLLMAQTCTYLATAPKSNSSYAGLKKALATVKETGTLEVPNKLRNAPTGLMTEMGYGQGYVYPHDHGGYVRTSYLPDELAGQVFYEPTQNGHEKRVRDWLNTVRQEDNE